MYTSTDCSYLPLTAQVHRNQLPLCTKELILEISLSSQYPIVGIFLHKRGRLHPGAVEEEAVLCGALSLTVPCGQHRQLSALHRAPRPTRPERHNLGHNARQGYVIVRIRALNWWPQTPHPVPKGATYSKPVSHGFSHLKLAGSLQSVAEERVVGF